MARAACAAAKTLCCNFASVGQAKEKYLFSLKNLLTMTNFVFQVNGVKEPSWGVAYGSARMKALRVGAF